MKIEIAYNSYTYEFGLKTDDKSFSDEKSGSQCKQLIKDSINKRIEVWFESFLEKLGEDFNRPELEIAFTSTQYEIHIIEEIISKINKKYNWKISIKNIIKGDKNVLGELHKLINSIETNKENTLYKQLDQNNILLKIKDIDSREVSVVVVAPMSAGKSTLINALIGKNILPSKNAACTASICKIKDKDGKQGFDAIIRDSNHNILVQKENIDLKFISEYNDKGNEEDVEIYIEGDIKSIDSSDFKLVLVDTPGPNNSQNPRHKKITIDYIKDKKNNPLILYVLDATKLKTNDDKSILTEISDFINTSDSKAKERIIFVLNRIDDFKKNDGDIKDILDDCKEYLSGFEITNPKIFPISAQLAKLALLNEAEILDEEDSEELIYLSNRMKRKDIISLSSLSKKQQDLLREESNVNEHTAQLYYSGLPALQIYINDYVNNRHKIEVSHELVHTLKPFLEDVILEHQKQYDSSNEDLENFRSDLERMTSFDSKEYEESKKKLSDKINGISEENKVLDGLNQKVKKSFDNIMLKLSNHKEKPEIGKILIAEADKIYKDLVISITTTIKSENDSVFDGIKSEIQDMIEVSFKQLITNAKLSDRNKGMLNNHIQFIVINAEAEIADSIYNDHVKTTTVVTDSIWYNPFSWGRTKDKTVIEIKKKVDLVKIWNSSFNPIQLDLISKLDNMKSSYKEEIQGLKNEGLSKIKLIESNLAKKIEEEKAMKAQVKLSESVRMEKEIELYKLKSYQKTLKGIIS